jgi:hypothetical protein
LEACGRAEGRRKAKREGVGKCEHNGLQAVFFFLRFRFQPLLDALTLRVPSSFLSLPAITITLFFFSSYSRAPVRETPPTLVLDLPQEQGQESE